MITVNNQYYFCATYAESKQGDALADFVYTQQGKTKAATVKLTGDDTVTANINKFKRIDGEAVRRQRMHRRKL